MTLFQLILFGALCVLIFPMFPVVVGLSLIHTLDLRDKKLILAVLGTALVTIATFTLGLVFIAKALAEVFG
jgi:hypothetical protein